MGPTTPATHMRDVPGARLYYEVRGSGPLLLLVGAPMESDLADVHGFVEEMTGRSPCTPRPYMSAASTT